MQRAVIAAFCLVLAIDLSGQGATADRVERQRRSGSDNGIGEILHECRTADVTHVPGARAPQQILLLPCAHDIHQPDIFGDADPVEHLA